MESFVLLLAVLFLPALCAVVCYWARKAYVRNSCAAFCLIAMLAIMAGMLQQLFSSGGRISIVIENPAFDLDWLIKLFTMFILIYFIYLGIRLKRISVSILATVQLAAFALAVVYRIFGPLEKMEITFFITYLSVVIIFLILTVGATAAIFTFGYIYKHERYPLLKKSAQAPYLAAMLVFVSAVGALFTIDNVLWMYFFWMVSALCCLYLASYSLNTSIDANAVRVLRINLLTGTFYVAAVIAVYIGSSTLSTAEIRGLGYYGRILGLLPLCLTLVSFADVIRILIVRMKKE